MHLILFKHRRLQKAEHALNIGKHQKALNLGRALVGSSKNEIAFRANRLCGLALYKTKQYEESLVFLQKSCQLGNYRHDWYNLSMALVYAGKLAEAEEAFANIYRTNVQSGYMFSIPVSGLLFQYFRALKLMQFTDAAIRRANELKQMYAGVGSDTAKQIQRGLPPYPTFRKEVEPLLSSEQLVAWERNSPLR